MKRIYIILLFCTFNLFSLFAQDGKAEADSLYASSKYTEAIEKYESILKQGDNAFIYYNLGNAYYRTNDLAHAILNYERAAYREPGNKDIRFNLTLARSKTIDKIENNEFFLSYWIQYVVNRCNSDTWGRWAIFLFVVTLLCFLGYFFMSKLLFRKLCFSVFCVGVVFTILFNIFAMLQRQEFLDANYAIVMNTAQIFSTPAESGTSLFTLHEGTKVEITDNTMKSWLKIELSDGKTGWIKVSDIERI